MPQEDDYVLGRGIVQSVRSVYSCQSLPISNAGASVKKSNKTRLDAQHLLWKLHRGYELHPLIPIKDDMKIAELGTGTAVWIFDLARQLPPTVQLQGFDISNRQFPVRDTWPQNVTLGTLDSLVDPPASLCGQFDVVHLRMWASNLRQHDTSALIGHPGGYLQWEDADLVNQHIQGQDAERFEQQLNEVFRKKFDVLEAEKSRFRPELAQLCTNTYLMALLEILQGIKRILAHDSLLSIVEQELALHRLSSNNTEVIYNWSPLAILAQYHKDDL
ncbi:hypothetical protein N7468_002874 [Penicillium chermesinum]|uniref:Methyltransferase domain-containing protein n=1 Tax=Penicillium chermesinum TaxID=63820 RepID=A0A9W9PJC4_9EURO|nr:uncharacterized protein N7468_002874 [Penicillium chermesinum]KAJ5247891.1 hypothetical protein N7468_002874 [Penicillium chermesinum]